MGCIGDLRAALANETSQREFAEARLADCQRRLAEARKTIKALAQLAASKPGQTEVGVIAAAALLETPRGEDEPPRTGGVATARAR